MKCVVRLVSLQGPGRRQLGRRDWRRRWRRMGELDEADADCFRLVPAHAGHRGLFSGQGLRHRPFTVSQRQEYLRLHRVSATSLLQSNPKRVFLYILFSP